MIPRTAAWLACQLPVCTAEYTGPSRSGCPCILSIRPALAATTPSYPFTRRSGPFCPKPVMEQ